ncbi:MAG TPA: hypothetical protein VK882_00310 [Nitrososphaeraceae archaeon]|jgi:hypothetical protein|nr:hypothetical protein [Nitrososphaeraceae archaeon]
MNRDNTNQLNSYIRGFESDSPESLGEKITTFLTENPELELKDVKYNSYGFIHNLNRETSYSALVICLRR